MQATNRQHNIVSPWSQVDKLGALPPEVDNEGNIEYKVSANVRLLKMHSHFSLPNRLAQTRESIR